MRTKTPRVALWLPLVGAFAAVSFGLAAPSPGFGASRRLGGGARVDRVVPTTAEGTSLAQVDAPRVPVTGAPMRGPADALVTIVEFAEFQCPFSARVAPILEQLRQQYGRDLRIVWRNLPLAFHPNARPAALAAMAAHRQRRFWEMHDLLFQNQRALAVPSLEGYARQLGLDMNRFRADMASPATAALLDADVVHAQQLQISGTPNFMVNGTPLTGAQPVQAFVALIDRVLAQARTITPRTRVYERMVGNPLQATP